MPHTDRSGITTPGKIRNAKPGTRSGPVRIATHHPPHTPTAETRHTFAVATLLDWCRDGGDIAARMPLLPAYLGHADPAGAYWRLHAAPELLAEAARRPGTAPGEPR